MTTTSRFAISPVALPDDPVSPEAIDRTDFANAWLVIGQALMVFWLVIGFGALDIGTTTTLGLSVILLGGLLITAPRGTFSQIRISVPILLLAIWWLLSYRWTLSTGSWWVRTKGEFGSLAIPIIAAAVLPTERITQMFRWAFYGVVALTFGATAASPGTTMQHVDASGNFVLAGWHGTFIHKNDMAFFLLIGLISVLVFEPKKWLRVASTIVTIALIVLGKSGTGMLGFVIVMSFMIWLRAHRRQPLSLRRWFAAVSTFLGIGLVGIMIPLYPVLLQLGGKDPTISGRTDIWASSWIALQERPWTGFGIGGIWDNQAVEPTKSIVARVGFIIFHSHAGPLELAMKLGFIGLILGLWIAAGAVRHGWWLQRARHNVGLWTMSLMMMMLVTWFSENTMTGEWLGLLGMLSILGRREREALIGTAIEPPPPARPRVL